MRDFLVDRFKIDAARLTIEGQGEDDPIASNDHREGRFANRRIEVLLLNPAATAPDQASAAGVTSASP